MDDINWVSHSWPNRLTSCLSYQIFCGNKGVLWSFFHTFEMTLVINWRYLKNHWKQSNNLSLFRPSLRPLSIFDPWHWIGLNCGTLKTVVSVIPLNFNGSYFQIHIFHEIFQSVVNVTKKLLSHPVTIYLSMMSLITMDIWLYFTPFVE